MPPLPTEEQFAAGRRGRARVVDPDVVRRRERVALALLVVGTILFFTREAVLVPFTVGWPAAKLLVQSESELAALRAQAAEYRSAAKYFGTPAGQDYARKLVYNQQDPGEKRLQVEAVPESRRATVGRRVHDWFLGLFEAGADGQHERKEALKRWLVDPVEPPRPGGTGIITRQSASPPETPVASNETKP